MTDKEKSREYTRRSREKEKARIGEDEYRRKRTEYMREYRKTEKGKAYIKSYTAAHSKENNARSKKYREDHWEEMKAKRRESGYNEYMKQYYYRHKEENEAIKQEVLELRAQLNRAEPEYDFPPLPKRDPSDHDSVKEYNRAIHNRRKLKQEYMRQELERLRALAEKE